jgi:GTP cyclohydrolase II
VRTSCRTSHSIRVEANLAIGRPVDSRDFGEMDQVAAAVGIKSVRLLTKNPEKVQALIDMGIAVTGAHPVHVAPNVRQARYLHTTVSGRNSCTRHRQARSLTDR